MGFDDVPAQSPIFPPEAEAYAERALDLSRAGAEQCDVSFDLPYGPHRRQRLDVYRPAQPPPGSVPVIVFAHGGAWTHGHKEWMGLLGPVVTSHPAILVSVSYRLSPDDRYPRPFEDCLAALGWVHENIATHGGDPDRIFVGGHSSGGSLYSLVTLRRDALRESGLPATVVKGCCPISTRFNLVFGDPAPDTVEARHKALIFERDEDAESASPIHHLEGNRVPFLLSYGSRDMPSIIENNDQMFAALHEQGSPVERLVLEGYDHFDTALRIRNPADPWFQTVRSWMLDGASRSATASPGDPAQSPIGQLQGN